jgi:uncharacterized membrane protein YfcA
MPGVMLWLALVLPLLTLAHEGRSADWSGLGWAFAGRVAGTAGGALVVARLPARALGIAVGVMVLAAVVLTARSVHVRLTRATLLGAGVVSGVTGTATSIGGPPMALLYQRAHGPTVRATLAVFFTGGAAISLGGLALAGELPGRQLRTAIVLLPCLALGFVLAGPLRRHVDAGRTRAAVLVVCAASALALLVRSLA